MNVITPAVTMQCSVGKSLVLVFTWISVVSTNLLLLLFSVSMFAARFTFEVMMLYCRMKQTEAPQFTAVASRCFAAFLGLLFHSCLRP